MNTFTTQPHTQRKALNKALESPNIGKHGKRRTTLLKEEAYKEMQQRILENIQDLLNAQIKCALTGKNGDPDPKVINSLLDRLFGKPGQEVVVKTQEEVTFAWENDEKRNVAKNALTKYLNKK